MRRTLTFNLDSELLLFRQHDRSTIIFEDSAAAAHIETNRNATTNSKIMEVLPQGSGHGLFATRTYEVGEAIIADEKPLFVIDEADSGAMELSIVLEKLKTVFDSITGPDQLAVLALYCPEDGELKLMDTLLAPVSFDKVDSLARRLYPSLTTVNEKADQNQLTKLFYIWKINSTRYQAQSSAIFEIHARINHSCSPNASFRSGTIRAQKIIRAGQEITHSYLDMERSIASTPVRRHLLNQQFLFHCACPRCIRTVDLSRIMKCPACSKHALVPGFSSTEELPSKGGSTSTKEIAATCTLCSKTFGAESLPLEEEGELENTVLTLWNQLASPHTQTSPIVQIQQLHKNVIQVLGAAHWTAAAMTKIRYDTDPMVNGFVILSWGEAYAKWCQIITKDDIPLLAPMVTYTIGRNCEPLVSKPPGTQKKLFEISGRRYWNECYPLCRKLWGTVDPHVLDMEQMFAQSKMNSCRVDLVVCTDKMCTNKTDDTIQTQSDDNDQDKKKACAACGLAHYCGRKCQKEDWSAHKEVCKSTRDLKDLVAVVGALKFARRSTE